MLRKTCEIVFYGKFQFMKETNDKTVYFIK